MVVVSQFWKKLDTQDEDDDADYGAKPSFQVPYVCYSEWAEGGFFHFYCTYALLMYVSWVAPRDA